MYTLSIRRQELESVQSLKSEAISINKASEERRKSDTDSENEKKKPNGEVRQEITKQEKRSLTKAKSARGCQPILMS